MDRLKDDVIYQEGLSDGINKERERWIVAVREIVDIQNSSHFVQTYRRCCGEHSGKMFDALVDRMSEESEEAE